MLEHENQTRYQRCLGFEYRYKHYDNIFDLNLIDHVVSPTFTEIHY